MAYDAAVATQYAEAVVADNVPLQTFLRTTIMRPGFLPILDEWEADIKATGQPPPNLVENQEYLDDLFAEANRYDDDAAALSAQGDEAKQHADDYIADDAVHGERPLLRRCHGVVLEPVHPLDPARRITRHAGLRRRRASPATPSPIDQAAVASGPKKPTIV